MRYLALDWGSKRVGGAVSDPDGRIAFALDKFFDRKRAVSAIKTIIRDLSVEALLVGLPRSLEGKDTASTQAAREFGAALQQQTGLSVEFCDERLSSVSAGKALQAQGYNAREQRSLADNLAAQQMLQRYLDTKNSAR